MQWVLCSYSVVVNPYDIFKMAISVLVAIFFLLMSVSEVISQCPPSSGKTLDVYSNNCIGFYRYLPAVRRNLLF